MNVDCATNTETQDTHQKCRPSCSRCSLYRQSSYTSSMCIHTRRIQTDDAACAVAELHMKRTWPTPPRRTKFPVRRTPHKITIATTATFQVVIVAPAGRSAVTTSQTAWTGGHEDQMKSTCTLTDDKSVPEQVQSKRLIDGDVLIKYFHAPAMFSLATATETTTRC